MVTSLEAVQDDGSEDADADADGIYGEGPASMEVFTAAAAPHYPFYAKLLEWIGSWAWNLWSNYQLGAEGFWSLGKE